MKSQISKYFETRFSKYQCGFHKGSVGNGGAIWFIESDDLCFILIWKEKMTRF